MRHSLLILISAIWTAILLLVLAVAGGIAIGMVGHSGAYFMLVPLLAVFFGLMYLLFLILGEDIYWYQQARKHEADYGEDINGRKVGKPVDAHDWPFNHLRS
jgi:hypothetical protein